MAMINQNSPFPGMDPYLEDRWPEVHASLIVYARNQINQQLPDDLQANIEENLAVRYGDYEQTDRSIRPDLNISVERSFSSSQSSALSTIPVAKPTLMKRVPHPDRHIEIADQSGRVITAIEFLSSWNKVGIRARERYAKKQLDYQAAGINVVEIDLVREGSYVMLAELDDIPKSKRRDYKICVYRDIIPNQIELYVAPLQEALPNIRIPLRPSDTDVVLQLQALIDTCYQDGRYYRINYQVDPKPQFDDDTKHWFDERLREQGRRV